MILKNFCIQLYPNHNNSNVLKIQGKKNNKFFALNKNLNFHPFIYINNKQLFIKRATAGESKVWR